MPTDWMTPLPVRQVVRARDSELSPSRWPATLAPVAQILRDGLDLGPATVLVGENGTGKSTLVEAIAIAYGLSAEGGSTGAMHSTRRTESDLCEHLSLVRGAGASRWGYFLRAETMHGLFTYLQDTLQQDFHRFSHGESFLEMINSNRFAGDGFFVMDEPEAGLSFTAQLALVGALSDMVANGRAQVLIATHSPVLATLPGARILELDDEGLHERAWEDLGVVDHYRRFLDAPERYLRHLRD
ncbi:AAA family ATPase [Ornithinimicrobium sp. F0845]|uniref:AAA family ATPase n=1 Tax=Ornithinimicrobium sp. F0845 TaxID=2926412 RepID=UPI001FF57FE0|nr:AAA family ATPase [Ornithinimicrobium sp. F0845]MCK0112144.1 AAA family ATPase [Ornithinimicrobium sp. F0845]